MIRSQRFATPRADRPTSPFPPFSAVPQPISHLLKIFARPRAAAYRVTKPPSQAGGLLHSSTERNT